MREISDFKRFRQTHEEMTMPAKRDGVITTTQARKLLKDESAMKAAIICLQIEAGDRVEDPRLRNPNQTDEAKGYRRLADGEWDDIRGIVRTLVNAAIARRSGAAPGS
jgi:hypothetical protein